MDLLVKAAVWAATNPVAENEVFNVCNGDLFRWENLWPQTEDFFEIAVAAPHAIWLTERMAYKAGVWERVAVFLENPRSTRTRTS